MHTWYGGLKNTFEHFQHTRRRINRNEATGFDSALRAPFGFCTKTTLATRALGGPLEPAADRQAGAGRLAAPRPGSNQAETAGSSSYILALLLELDGQTLVSSRAGPW